MVLAVHGSVEVIPPHIDHALDALGVRMVTQPKPQAVPTVAWKPAYKGDECPW